MSFLHADPKEGENTSVSPNSPFPFMFSWNSSNAYYGFVFLYYSHTLSPHSFLCKISFALFAATTCPCYIFSLSCKTFTMNISDSKEIS